MLARYGQIVHENPEASYEVSGGMPALKEMARKMSGGFCHSYPGFRRATTTVDKTGHRVTLNHMVKFSDIALDRTFAALADPTRRALVMRLAEKSDVSVSELAAPFAMSLPAVMKHLGVLSDAGLVSRAKTGRVVACRLDAEPMRDAFEWLNRYEKFWSERLSNLAAFLEEEESLSQKEKSWPPKPPSNQASPSSAASRRRPPKSLPRGQSRKR
jgi:DNA-binding transcriptional ArsR family regulator